MSRLPRKVKKALRQLELAPRITKHSWFQTIQFGCYSVKGKRTKWTSKAEKVLRGREATRLNSWICDTLRSSPPAGDFSKTAEEIEDLYFEWEIVNKL